MYNVWCLQVLLCFILSSILNMSVMHDFKFIRVAWIASSVFRVCPSAFVCVCYSFLPNFCSFCYSCLSSMLRQRAAVKVLGFILSVCCGGRSDRRLLARRLRHNNTELQLLQPLAHLHLLTLYHWSVDARAASDNNRLYPVSSVKYRRTSTWSSCTVSYPLVWCVSK